MWLWEADFPWWEWTTWRAAFKDADRLVTQNASALNCLPDAPRADSPQLWGIGTNAPKRRSLDGEAASLPAARQTNDICVTWSLLAMYLMQLDQNLNLFENSLGNDALNFSQSLLLEWHRQLWFSAAFQHWTATLAIYRCALLGL